MTLAEIVLAFLGSNAITAIITAWLGRRKAGADADHTIVESASDVLAMAKAAYEARIVRLEAQVVELAERLTKAEARATGAESRLADSEARASEFRRAVIAIGEGREQDRLKARAMVTKLVGVINHLLSCIEKPDKDKIVDRVAITQLISEILADYPAEQFVRI